MNPEIGIIGASSSPIANGTAKRRTAKAAMRPRAMRIFFGSAFGREATSKTYVADSY